MIDFEYINRTYGLSVKRGSRVRYTGDCVGRRGGGKLGTVRSVDGAYLMIRMDGESFVQRYHPTWELEILPDYPTPPVRDDMEN